MGHNIASINREVEPGLLSARQHRDRLKCSCDQRKRGVAVEESVHSNLPILILLCLPEICAKTRRWEGNLPRGRRSKVVLATAQTIRTVRLCPVSVPCQLQSQAQSHKFSKKVDVYTPTYGDQCADPTGAGPSDACQRASLLQEAGRASTWRTSWSGPGAT